MMPGQQPIRSAPRAARLPEAIRLELDPAAKDAAVRGDRQKLASLATNLLDNAVRHGPEGGRVLVALRRAGGHVVLAVADEGPGIPVDLRDRVFESYYRIPGTRGSGSGLGLAIAREVAESHGARIAIDEGPGSRGAQVTVSFSPA